jgi:hypothetical protein
MLGCVNFLCLSNRKRRLMMSGYCLDTTADPEIKLTLGKVTEVTKSKALSRRAPPPDESEPFFSSKMAPTFFTLKNGSKELFLLNFSRPTPEEPEPKPEMSLAKRGL